MKGDIKRCRKTSADVQRCCHHTPDTLGTLPDIEANARPLRAWLKWRTITTHARESVADLSCNCKGFRARDSVHARVTEPRAQGTGVGRDIRQSPSRVWSVFLLIYGCHHLHRNDVNINGAFRLHRCASVKVNEYMCTQRGWPRAKGHVGKCRLMQSNRSLNAQHNYI